MIATKADMRKQLRWAWSKLGCRCWFDKFDRKVLEDAHCPVHGWYNCQDEDGPWNPFLVETK